MFSIFCMYVHQIYWSVRWFCFVFFWSFCSVWFWYQGKAGLVEYIWKFSFLFFFWNPVKPWFASIIHSRNMLVIQSACISKWILSAIGSVVIMWHSVSHTTRITRHHLFIKLKFIRNVCLSCRTSYLQSKVSL